MHPIGRFRRSWNNPGYGPQSFPKVGAGNKRFEHFNLTKALDETDLESVINAMVEQFPDYDRAAKK